MHLKKNIILLMLFASAALNAAEQKTAKIHPAFGLTQTTEKLLKQIKSPKPSDNSYELNESDITELLKILQKTDMCIKAIVENIGNAKTIGYRKNLTIDFISGKDNGPIRRSFSMGMLSSTGQKLDMAISADVGMFGFSDDSGRITYSREGSFRISSDRIIRNSAGQKLLPQIQIKPDDLVETMTISEVGSVKISNDGGKPREIGQIVLFAFQNPQDLIFERKCNCFYPKNLKDKPKELTPGLGGAGGILQGFLELSNANIYEEQAEYLSLIRFYNLIYDAISRLDPRFVGAYKTHILDPAHVKELQEALR